MKKPKMIKKPTETLVVESSADEDELIFIPPPPVPVIAIEDESDGKVPSELKPPHDERSSDFLKPTPLDNPHFKFSLHGPEFQDQEFARHANPDINTDFIRNTIKTEKLSPIIFEIATPKAKTRKKRKKGDGSETPVEVQGKKNKKRPLSKMEMKMRAPWRQVPPILGRRRVGPPPRYQRTRNSATAQSQRQLRNGGWGQKSQGGNKNGWNSSQFAQGYEMWNSLQTETWKYRQSGYSGQAGYSFLQSGYNSGQSYNNQQYGTQQQQGYVYDNYGSWNQGYGQGQQQPSWSYYGQYGQNQSGWENQRQTNLF